MSRFGGDKKVGASILGKWEKSLIAFLVPKIPKAITSVHLTLMTIPISALIIASGYLYMENRHWIWAISVAIVMQYLTDSLDGTLGRYRGEGLIKWGFYVDHFLDFVFLGSLVISGFFITPEPLRVWMIVMGFLLSGFMVGSFLYFSATNKFAIYHYGFGPTEFRLVLILINTYIYYAGTGYFHVILPATCAVLFLVLSFLTYNTQKEMMQLDMENKARTKDVYAE